MPSRESSVIRHSSHISFSNPSVVLTSSCHCFCLRSHATSQGQKAKELLFSVSLLRFVLSLIVRAAKFPNLSDPAFSVLWWIHHMSYVKKKPAHLACLSLAGYQITSVSFCRHERIISALRLYCASQVPTDAFHPMPKSALVVSLIVRGEGDVNVPTEMSLTCRPKSKHRSPCQPAR